MSPSRLLALRVVLVITGLTCLALWPLMLVWPSGWRWEPHHPHYEQMLMGVYFALGIFMLRAVRDPWNHLSLIRFTIWSSVVHGGIMTVQALSGPQHHGHLLADVPALFLAAAALAFLTPRGRAQDEKA